jgi:hypothetical protein
MFPLCVYTIILILTNANNMPIKSFKSFLREDTGEVSNTKPTYHELFHNKLKKEFGEEYPIILTAAKRNNIVDSDYDNLSMLYAIRRAENGRMGREFGVLSPRAMEQKGDTPQMTLDRQAGWAAASILSNRKRYEESDKSKPFEEFMAARWAPVGAGNDPTNLNANWAKNVTKFKSGFLDCSSGVCKPVETKKQETAPAPATKQEPVSPTPVQPQQTQQVSPMSSPTIPPLLNDPNKKIKKQ